MNNKVEDQYTNWVYPEPVKDMREFIATGKGLEIGEPFAYWPLMWPHKRSIGKLDILSAGCGTNQAAYYACRNPDWNVVGIDISESSLAHQQMLKEKHNLTNLTLKKLDLTKIESLGLDFDFITCTGVLHHLSDPDEGLLALRRVLRTEGVINLMVYGSALRIGVYMMQEVFRMLNLQQSKVDVDIVRETINSLHPDHVLRRYMKIANDLKYDGGIVDTFLHPQDRAYSVKEVFEFTRNAGLEFLNWTDPIEYSMEYTVPKSHSLWKKINDNQVSLEDKYHINDLLVQGRGTHRWFCAHPDYVMKCRITFEHEHFLDYLVNLHRSAKVIIPSDLSKKTIAELEREKFKFNLSSNLAAIIMKMDGKTSIRGALESLNVNISSNGDLIDSLRKEIKSLYDCGHIYVLLPEEK